MYQGFEVENIIFYVLVHKFMWKVWLIKIFFQAKDKFNFNCFLIDLGFYLLML